MTVTVTHAFHSNIADDGAAAAAGEVLPSHWNASHTVTGAYGTTPSGNIVLYVATTGNDSTGDGTVGNPFLTLQHAINVAKAYDYGGGTFTLTINIAAGTYQVSTPIVLEPLIGYQPNQYAKIVGAGVGSTIIQDTSGLDAIYGQGMGQWSLDQLTIDSPGYALSAEQGCAILCPHGGAIGFNDSTAGGFLRCFQAVNGGLINALANVTITATTMYAFANSGIGGFFNYNAGTVTLPSSAMTGGNAWFYGPGEFAWSPVAVTHSTSFVAPQISIQGGAVIQTSDGTLSTVPGTSSSNLVDSTCVISNEGGSIADSFLTPYAGVPDTTALPYGTSWGVFKYTSGGGLHLAANDGGTIKRLQWSKDQITVGRGSEATGQVVFNGNTSGTVTLSVKDAAGTWTMNLPTSAGTAGYSLTTDGSGNCAWSNVSGTAAAAGLDTQIQYNNSGNLGADANFIWDYTNKVLKIKSGATVAQLNAAELTTNNTELILEQTGDALGTTRIHLQNRVGVNGAIFENAALDLVDFVLLTSTNHQGNYRFEHRAANLIDSANTAGELQELTNGSVTSWVGALSSGFNNQTGAIFYGTPSQGLSFVYAPSTGKITYTSISSGGPDLLELVLVSTGGGTGQCRFEHRNVGLLDTANTAGEMQFFTNNGNQLSAGQASVVLPNAVIVGSPTGGNKGVGTINVSSNIYLNNSAYTNPKWVLKKYWTGECDADGEYAPPRPYAGLMSLDDIEAFTRDHHDLPLMRMLDGKQGLFDGGDLVLASLEEAYLHIFALNRRINELERLVN